jgi:hypothetical protein
MEEYKRSGHGKKSGENFHSEGEIGWSCPFQAPKTLTIENEYPVISST